MAPKAYTFCYYVSGHGFGHATRVNQIITELLKSSSHTIHIVSDAPQFIFQDVIALGAIYRNAKVDAGVIQPLAYSIDRQKTIEGCKNFLSRRDEMIQTEVAWLDQVNADCVLADAPFLPCAAAAAFGIPAILITNFTFDEIYRFLRSGDALDKDVIACANAALEDYKKASLLLRLPGSIDIPSFEDEILALESSRSNGSPSISDMDDVDEDDDSYPHSLTPKESTNSASLSQPCHMVTSPSLLSARFQISASLRSPKPGHSSRLLSPGSKSLKYEWVSSIPRQAIDVPLVVRKHINTREHVLRSLGVDEETIATKKVVLVSFGGQRLKQGWGNPLPEGWIGVICGLPVEHELPEGFYRSPHGVYVPDLTHAADIVIGKLGYGTCSECIAHDRPLIYVPRPQFVEEHGLIRLMMRHGLPVEMTAEEFETGQWQRSVLEADRIVREEREGRRQHMASLSSTPTPTPTVEETEAINAIKALPSPPPTTFDSLAESVNNNEFAEAQPKTRRTRRSLSISSLVEVQGKPKKMRKLSVSLTKRSFQEEEEEQDGSTSISSLVVEGLGLPSASGWFERRMADDGGEVCSRLVEEFMAQLEEVKRLHQQAALPSSSSSSSSNPASEASAPAAALSATGDSTRSVLVA
ncbi:hypothetical protein DFQ27_006474 [Actinomortierella ambigua]|uniref:L-arabinokinase n=1 Tax=Actinomortierella ambigua TaxID=1343610 RepID=A0A9P6PVS9_9FUNG|nr:hypothetical protein DFQ27_006474 [Actinomortierella ambigua]